MKLRDHPLMFYWGLRSWPPLWIRLDEPSKRPFEGDEIGTLTHVRINDLSDCRIVLRMYDGKTEYLGHLMFDDHEFCLRVYDLLKHHVGKPVKDIGEIDLRT
jgi:hypothetical protein